MKHYKNLIIDIWTVKFLNGLLITSIEYYLYCLENRICIHLIIVNNSGSSEEQFFEACAKRFKIQDMELFRSRVLFLKKPSDLMFMTSVNTMISDSFSLAKDLRLNMKILSQNSKNVFVLHPNNALADVDLINVTLLKTDEYIKKTYLSSMHRTEQDDRIFLYLGDYFLREYNKDFQKRVLSIVESAEKEMLIFSSAESFNNLLPPNVSVLNPNEVDVSQLNISSMFNELWHVELPHGRFIKYKFIIQSAALGKEIKFFNVSGVDLTEFEKAVRTKNFEQFECNKKDEVIAHFCLHSF